MNKTVWFKKPQEWSDPYITVTDSYGKSDRVLMSHYKGHWYTYTITNENATNFFISSGSNTTLLWHIENSNTVYLNSDLEDVQNDFIRGKTGLIPYATKGDAIDDLIEDKIYLVCFKGDSIVNNIFDRLIRIFTKNKYTHVGLTSDITGDSITYYASRYDGGVNTYTEPKEDVDIYPIHLKTGTGINKFYTKTKGQYGSFVKDINHPELANTPLKRIDIEKSAKDYWRHPDKSEPGWGSVEWTATALNLALPYRYTIEKLIEFANME